MPNRSCDFCQNEYRKEPNTGYFKLTEFMKIKLDLLEVKADYICGLHFDPSSFTTTGRLKPNAIPTFFPSLANLKHDHPYCEGASQEGQVHAEDQAYCEIGMYAPQDLYYVS